MNTENSTNALEISQVEHNVVLPVPNTGAEETQWSIKPQCHIVEVDVQKIMDDLTPEQRQVAKECAERYIAAFDANPEFTDMSREQASKALDAYFASESVASNDMPEDIRNKEDLMVYRETDTALSEATEKLKAPLEDIDTSETILEGVLRILREEVQDTPQLRYFIEALEGEVTGILGEIHAYRDAHARVMTNWWSTLIAADPSPSSLALRATFDMETLANLSESSYIAWWADNVLPWIKHHGEFFNHEKVTEQTQAILDEIHSNDNENYKP